MACCASSLEERQAHIRGIYLYIYILCVYISAYIYTHYMGDIYIYIYIWDIKSHTRINNTQK